MKTAYAFHPQTLIFTGAVPVARIAGYPDYIKPRFALWAPVPAHDTETQQCRADLESQTWIVEAKTIEVTAYHKATQAENVFSDASEVTDDYTLVKPQTRFDEWDPALDAWVTNETNQYQYQVAAITDQRRAAYGRMSDPLYMEAHRLTRQGREVEAEEYALQADAAVQKIKADHPWPTPPEAA